MKTNLVEQIIIRLDFLLKEINQVSLTTRNIKFVLDEHLNFGKEVTVRKKYIFSAEEVEENLEPAIFKGASWIHANLISTTEDFNLVTLRFGNLVGNPEPHVNVSVESNSKIKII